MRGRTWLATLVLLPILAAGARGQNYTLTIKAHPEPGTSVTVTENNRTDIAVVVTAGGNVLKEDKKSIKEMVQVTEKVLETDNNGRKKFTRTYTKAAKGEGAEPTKLSYAGKTVTFERQGDKYVASANGVDEKDLKDLTKSVNNSIDEGKLVPPKAIQVGDSWAISKDVLSPILGEMKQATDITKLKATGKLTKAYKKDGQQWGTIEVTITAPINQFGPVKLQKPIPFQAKLTVDAPIDGSSTAMQSKGTLMIKGVGEFEQNGQTITLDVSIQGDSRQEQSAAK
jgi:hypothetical protein